jgi:uncharacterized protein (DUF983 family)
MRGRCPNCGEGALWSGFLTVSPACALCRWPLAEADTGEGPAVFVIMIVGFIVVFAALFTEIAYRPPIWLHLVLWLPLAAILSLALLRPAKGLMLAATIKNRIARERDASE